MYTKAMKGDIDLSIHLHVSVTEDQCSRDVDSNLSGEMEMSDCHNSLYDVKERRELQ